MANIQNRNYLRARVLTLIPVIVFAVTVICMVLAVILEVPTNRGTVYSALALIALMSIMISPAPCMALSIMGLIFAIKAIKEGTKKGIIFLALGIIEIMVFAASAIFAILLFLAGQSV